MEIGGELCNTCYPRRTLRYVILVEEALCDMRYRNRKRERETSHYWIAKGKEPIMVMVCGSKPLKRTST